MATGVRVQCLLSSVCCPVTVSAEDCVCPRVPSDRQEQDQSRQRITWSQLEVGSGSSPIVVVRRLSWAMSGVVLRWALQGSVVVQLCDRECDSAFK